MQERGIVPGSVALTLTCSAFRFISTANSHGMKYLTITPIESNICEEHFWHIAVNMALNTTTPLGGLPPNTVILDTDNRKQVRDDCMTWNWKIKDE
jgi:hypothetical protein